VKISLIDAADRLWKHDPDDEVKLVCNGEEVGLIRVAEFMRADLSRLDDVARSVRVAIRDSERKLQAQLSELEDEIERIRESALKEKRRD
jgi:hypothetical protein